MSNLDRLQPVANRLIDACLRDHAGDLTSLSPRDRVFFLVWCYAGQLDNGGHASFFYNSGANYFAETLMALKEVGLSRFAELLGRAATVLFEGPVPRDISIRNAVIDALPEDDEAGDEELEILDGQFFGAGGGTLALQRLEAWYFAPTSASKGG